MGTPIPNRAIERSVGSGEVKTYVLPPEELAKYDTEAQPKKLKGNPAKVPFTKEEYLRMRLEKTRTRIYTERGIKPPDFYAWLELHGMKDKQVEDQLVDELRQTEREGNEEPPEEEKTYDHLSEHNEEELLHDTTLIEDEKGSEEITINKPIFDELRQLIAGESVILSGDDLDRMKLALDLTGAEYEVKTITVIKLKTLEAGADLP